ncbi:MAG: TusE/DsrC/DsvC family sulfur relay protein [Pseudomonadota bacterium]
MTAEYTTAYAGREFATDVQGFLKHRLEWTTEIGTAIAKSEDVVLTEEHWEIVHYFREYYETYNVPPPMRMIVREFKKAFGETNANSRYLYKLFPEGPVKSASKYAGLPKPKNCK